MKFGTLLAIAACISCVVAAEKGRGQVCKNAEAKCIWLNEYLMKPSLMPLQSSVCPKCKPDVFCHEAIVLSLHSIASIWDSIYIIVDTSRPKNLAAFFGNSSRKGSSQAVAATSVHRLNPFVTQCVGVHHAGGSASRDSTPYSLSAHLKLWPGYPVLAAVGLVILYVAPRLSRNVPLIYGTGITLGILASVLVLLYILSRYMPGRSFLGIGVLAGGYTAIMALAYWTMDYVTEVLLKHWEYVLGYVCITGLLSFAVIYRWGGVNNPRTFDLIQWTLQLFAMFLLYWCTPVREFSLGMMFLVLCTYHIPLRWNPLMLPFYLCYHLLAILTWPVCWCWRRRPLVLPTKRLLTPEEYEEQGRRETAKELKRLQQYCREHEEEVLEKVQNTSRTRLGKFLQTGNHVRDDERVNHEWTFMEDSDSEEDVSMQSKDTSHSSADSQHRSQPSPPTPRTPSSYQPVRRHRDMNPMYYTSPSHLKY